MTSLTSCAAVFLPADPPRASRVAFWHPDREPPGETEDLTVVLPASDGPPAPRTVPARVLALRDALPVLTRARAAGGDPAAAFWGAAAVLALQLAARGRLLPGLTAADHDAWRLAPLEPADAQRLTELAAAMPTHAHAVALATAPDHEPLLPHPDRLLRAFLDAVADTLPRTPAAALAAGGPAFARADAHERTWPEHRGWAREVAAGHDTGVRLSLRVEVLDLPEHPARHEHHADGGSAGFRAVLQVHSLSDPTVVADAAELWSGSSRALDAFGPRAQADTLLTLRRAAAAWQPLAPLLTAAVPDAVDLAEEEVAELLGEPVSRALTAAGVPVHWPRHLLRALTAHVVVGPDTADEDGGSDGTGSATRHGSPSLLAPEQLLRFSWRVAVGDASLTRAELDRLAEAGRPLVRLRDQWVLLDPERLRRLRDRRDRHVTPAQALGAVLAGSLEEQDEERDEERSEEAAAAERVEVRATGWLADLLDRLAHPESATGPDAANGTVPPPPRLAATLRDYQLRGLAWLDRLTSLGLGACLADDMGLGKTVTLIALHLRRQLTPATAGPTLVVCPASLLGTWEREVARFAPGTPTRRYHGAARELPPHPTERGIGTDTAGHRDDHTAGHGDADHRDPGLVLTTYGTMRRDAALLAKATDWSLVVADEAQHVKNPLSDTARQLRTIPSRARVALTGTPVENDLSELWAILDWTTPGLLGRRATFRRRYAAAVEGGTDPAAAERLARLVRPFLLRRRKTDPGIAPELPPKTETDHAVSLTREQAALYEATVREGLAAVSEADGLARRGLVIRLLTSLKQICNHPAHFLKEDPTGDDGAAVRLRGRSGKLELFDELLETILASGGSVLVFTQYVRMARLLQAHLSARGVDSLLLHGGTPVPRREEMVRRFSAGEVPVFLLSLKAAGTGLTLTRAEHVVHFDRWWNPAVEAQATDRAHRIGQDRPVQVHRLIAEGTVEDRIDALLRRKRELAEAVLGAGASGEAALTELSDDDLAALVRLQDRPGGEGRGRG
ncbi:SNF2-related protein [Streptomyces sp. 4N509B]|uniref:SNF2-related protein n=1 Tax=Streptomyces sp. 4N509B TaxID=3457413 RepID=UPI003FCFAEBE